MFDLLGKAIQLNNCVTFVNNKRKVIDAVVCGISPTGLQLNTGKTILNIKVKDRTRIPYIVVKPEVAQEFSESTVVKVVIDHFRISVEQLLSQTRKRTSVVPRQLCIYLLSRRYNYSDLAIQRVLGYISREKIYHSVRVVTNAIDTKDPLYLDHLHTLSSKLDTLYELRNKQILSK